MTLLDFKRARQTFYRGKPDERLRQTLRDRYRMSLDEYRELLAEQGGRCAICGEPPKRRRLCVDHCHEAGRVRGLLCHRCNIALGFFERHIAPLIGRVQEYLSQRSA